MQAVEPFHEVCLKVFRPRNMPFCIPVEHKDGHVDLPTLLPDILNPLRCKHLSTKSSQDVFIYRFFSHEFTICTRYFQHGYCLKYYYTPLHLSTPILEKILRKSGNYNISIKVGSLLKVFYLCLVEKQISHGAPAKKRTAQPVIVLPCFGDAIHR